ncbi:MAG: succinate dehydrogenase, cytochrome b556 subunit, partial [Mesorhizobium sp.]
MSKSPATREFARRERPLSPHLTVYRPPITMT